MAYSSSYGDPVISVRLPRELINAAKIDARQSCCSFSVFVRDAIKAQLIHDRIPIGPADPEPGQLTVEDVCTGV